MADNTFSNGDLASAIRTKLNNVAGIADNQNNNLQDSSSVYHCSGDVSTSETVQALPEGTITTNCFVVGCFYWDDGEGTGIKEFHVGLDAAGNFDDSYANITIARTAGGGITVVESGTSASWYIFTVITLD